MDIQSSSGSGLFTTVQIIMCNIFILELNEDSQSRGYLWISITITILINLPVCLIPGTVL